MPFPPPFVWRLAAVLLIVAIGWLGYRFWRQHSIRALQAACLTALDEQQWDRAEQSGLRWLALEPRNTRILLHLADAAKGQSAFDRTADYLLRVADDDPEALVLLSLAADLQFKELIKPFQAEQTWLRMLAIEPRADVPRKKLAYFYALSLQRSRLRDQIREALRTQSESPDTYVYLMVLYELRFTDAFAKLSNWLRNDPENETLLVAQALALALAPTNVDPRFYAGTGIKPGDRSLVERCEQRFPDNLELLSFQLSEAIDRGDVAEVGRMLQTCPPESEQDPRFWRARGWYLRAQNQSDAAEQACRRALELYPFDWRSRHELAQVERRLGRHEPAEREAQLALDGKQLERDLMEIPDTSQASPTVLGRIRDYAAKVNAHSVVQALDYRLSGDDPELSTIPPLNSPDYTPTR